jgi:hypothetical protein
MLAAAVLSVLFCVELEIWLPFYWIRDSLGAIVVVPQLARCVPLSGRSEFSSLR